MISLRDYQITGVSEIREKYAQGFKSPLYVLPTGGGKTVVFCYIAFSALSRGKRVYIIVHRDNLLMQASKKLSSYGIPHGRIGGGRTQTKDLIQVASVQTLIRRLDDIPEPDLLIFDEGHHLTKGTMWGKVIERWKNARALGVTATPIRLDNKGLGVNAGGYYDSMVLGPNIQDLILESHLSRPLTYRPPSNIDLSGVKRVAGDYQKSELEKRVGAAKITGDAIAHYRKLAEGQPAIAFCISVAHAESVAADFRAAGYNFVSIDGSMERSRVYDTIDDLAAGRIHGITSCDLISEGTDVPVVSCGIFLRPTQSTALYLQQAGRILRPYEGKTRAILLDHVGNSIDHGLPESPREWSLDGTPRKKREQGAQAGSDVKVTQCGKCFNVFQDLPACPECGEPVPDRARKIEQVDGELEAAQMELKAQAEKLERKKEIANALTYQDFVDIAKRRGYNIGWAKHMYSWKKSHGGAR